MLNQIVPFEISIQESDGVPDSSELEIVGPVVMTRQQVASVKDRTLIVYKNEVFDVSNYVDLHPGGSKYLLEYAGRDVSQEFDQVGHSKRASKQLGFLKIGEIDPEDIAEV